MSRQNGHVLLSIIALLGAVSACTSARAGDGLDGKMIVGYQGWFGCPGDFEGNKAWQHWFVGQMGLDHLKVDLLPSVRKFAAADLCDTGMRRADGIGTIKLFSSQNPNIVDTHFRWMADAGIDGVAAQRFVGPLSDPAMKRRSDHVFQNIRLAAETNKRSFFVVYDVSGANAQSVVDDIRTDWRYVVNQLKLTSSPAYLRDGGKPVLELWGFGFTGRPGSAEEVTKLINDLKNGHDGLAAATVIGGVPSHWRTLTGDSKSETAWADTYRQYDVISPWYVGRFNDDISRQAYMHGVAAPDLVETKKLGVRYMPVVFPGFSWVNMKVNRDRQHDAVLNQIPRRCGQFMWGQVSDLLEIHATMLYAAMFDEADEGTALFPVETREDKLPAGAKMVYLNEDGCALPDDWYLRIVGKAGEFLRQHEQPPRKLSDVIRP